MPFIVFTPVPAIPTPSGTFGAISGGGAQTELDYTNTLGALGVQLQQIQYYLSGGPGGIAATEPGSMLNSLLNSAHSLANIDSALQTLVLGNNKQVGAQLSGANSVQSSLSTIAGLLTTMIAMQQMSMSAQMNHQQFVEQTTNTARTEDGKLPVAVKQEAFVEKVKTSSLGIANISAISTASGVAQGIATDALSAGTNIAKNLVASTDIGQNLISSGTKMKAWVNTQVADIEAVAQLKKKEAEAKALKLKAQQGGAP